MLVVQLSDIHILRAPAQGIAMLAGNAARLERTIRFIKKHDPLPDVAVISGDLSHEGDAQDYRYCRSLLSALPCPYLVVPGNHDDRNFVRQAFPLEGLQADGAFYQFEDDRFPLRILGLDTLEPGKVGGELCAARLDWIGEALARSQKPTLVVMHHPPYQFGLRYNADMACTHGIDRLEAMIRKHGNVVGVVCGHLHVGTATTWAGVPSSTVPAVAPGFSLEIGQSHLAGWHNSSPAVGLHIFRENRLTTHVIHINDDDSFVAL